MSVCHDRSITVLMPVFNGERYLASQLDSILAETAVGRVIICDDASTDRSFECLQAFVNDGRVEVLRNVDNRGVIRTVESLLGMVSSAFFALADQDDVWVPNRLPRYVDMLKSTGALLAYSDLTVVRENLSLICPSRWRLSNQRPLSGNAVESLIIKSPVNGCTVVGRSELLRHVLPFPVGIPMHDTWMASVAAALGKLEFIDDQTVMYRQHGNNESGGASPYTVLGAIRRIRRHAGGSIRKYSAIRLRDRLALLDGLRARGLASPHQEKLRTYYASGTLGRLVGLPFYIAVLVRRCRRLGLRNLITDVTMTLIPANPSVQLPPSMSGDDRRM
jgi:glycosyltransferase involved in cell wall biosynthesis